MIANLQESRQPHHTSLQRQHIVHNYKTSISQNILKKHTNNANIQELLHTINNACPSETSEDRCYLSRLARFMGSSGYVGLLWWSWQPVIQTGVTQSLQTIKRMYTPPAVHLTASAHSETAANLHATYRAIRAQHQEQRKSQQS